MKTIENVLIYISDSVRWDIGRDLFAIRNWSPIKTLAHSTFTFSSIPSILLGVLPQRHGVYSPRHTSQVDVTRTMFDVEGLNSYLNLEPGQDVIHRHVFPGVDRGDLAEIEPPFVAVEHDIGGHAPYGTDYSNVENFFRNEATNRDTLRSYYTDAVRDSMDQLEGFLQTLSERGLLDSTLVVATSDHGELLYDYGGLTGHVRPVSPELVYVPTVISHPAVSTDDLPEFLHHIDITPTVFDALDLSPADEFEGQSLLDPDYKIRPGVNMTRFHPRFLSEYGEQSLYHQESVWDEDGGHVFLRKRLPTRLAAFGAEAVMTRKFVGGRWHGYHPESLFENAKLYVRRCQQFSDPNIEKDDARTLLERNYAVNSTTESIDAETESRLEDLGYI
jgi:hypothetical protein